MSFIDIAGLDSEYEDEAVPEGEYEVRVIDAKHGRNKKDTADQIMVMLKVEDPEYPNSATIFHYLTFPGDGDNDDQKRGKMRNLTRFLKTFNISYEKKGFNTEDLVGATTTCLVGQEEYNDSPVNRLKLSRVD